MDKYICESIRLCRYLYSLGFDKESIEKDGNEIWQFEKSDDLQKSLDFYFYMRKILKEKRLNNKGVNENAVRKKNILLDTRRR